MFLYAFYIIYIMLAAKHFHGDVFVLRICNKLNYVLSQTDHGLTRRLQSSKLHENVL